MKIAMFAIVALAGSVASAKVLDTSVAALQSGSFDNRAQAAWTTSFEAPAFNAGFSLAGQNGWAANAAGGPATGITNQNAQDGTQSVRQVDSATAANGALSLNFSPSVAQPANTADVTSWWFFISSAGGADYGFVGQAPSQGFLTWRMNLSFLGTIQVLDDGGEGLMFMDTAQAFPVGEWFQLGVATNPAADSINYYLNGNLFYSSVAGVFAGTSVEQFVTINDNFQNSGEFADLDNIGSTIIPTPGAVALLGLGGLVAARRRRA